MMAVWLALGALLLVAVLGLLLLIVACVRGPIPDMTQPKTIAKFHREEQTEEILAGIRLLQSDAAEEVFLRSFDGLRLHGRLLQQPQAKATLLLFHGYRSSWVSDFSIVLPHYYSQGYNLLVVDERAHGQSEGTYITFGIRERRDVQTWAEYAAMHFGPSHPLLLDGLSMGATTVLLAAALPLPASVRGILADSGFTSPYEIMRSVLRAHCKLLPPQPILALLNVFTRVFAGFSLKEASTPEALRATTLPVLLLHGKSDTFVPYTMSQAAYDACGAQKQLVLVDEAGHGYSYLVDRPRVQAAIAAFIGSQITKEE